MSSDEEVLVTVMDAASMLRLPSTQTLWNMIHAGVMQAVWDKGRHSITRSALISYLETALDRAKAATADGEPVTEHSPFSYGQAAALVRRKIAEGDLQPGDRVVVKDIAAECGFGVNTVRKGLVLLVQHGDLRQYNGRGWIVSPREH